jgi:predicted negative regulator of RcsB-dependent stress response
MAAQSIASRPRRPQQTEPDDAVLARALQFAEWARRNIILIIAGAVVLVLLLGGLFWYRADRAARLDAAAIEFMTLEQTVRAGDESIAVRDLQLFVQRHDGTPYADEARLMLGRLHMEGGRPEEAQTVLRPVADRLEPPVGAAAALLLAAAQEQAGQQQDAIRTYLRVGDRAPADYQREEGLSAAAILREEVGDYAGAAEIYRRLIGMADEGSQARTVYEMRLAEATARATTQ